MINSENFSEAVKSMRQRTTRLEREGDYWRPEEREKVIELFNSGVGITEIAILLQRTEPAVYQQMEKLDLYKRKAYPMRRRALPQPSECLCGNCKCPRALCPLCEAAEIEQEAV